MPRSSAEVVIKENMEKIKEWLAGGMTMQSIAKALGVSKTTIYKYLNDDDLNTIKSGRKPCVDKLEDTMYTSAKGFERKVKKYAKVKRCIYNENGKKAEEWEEMVEYEETQYFPPDTTAGIFLLKNWANYKNEPAAMQIREKELELRKKQVEAAIW